MAKKTAGISIRIEPELKVEAEKILNDLNVSVSELISVLYKQIIIKQGIPFPIDLLENENQETENGLLLEVNGTKGYFPKEYIVEAIQTHLNIEKIKAEIIGGFAEELKEKLQLCDTVIESGDFGVTIKVGYETVDVLNAIDNLVKEKGGNRENQAEKYAELLKERVTYSVDDEGNINSCHIDDIIDEVTEVFNGKKEKWWGTALDNTIL